MEKGKSNKRYTADKDAITAIYHENKGLMVTAASPVHSIDRDLR